jgi:drug/metabolite transporter (DMT)-like permease
MTVSTPDTTRSMTSVAWAALIVVYIVWGSTYLGIGIVIETIPPLLGGAMRFIAAAVLLGIALSIRYGPGVLRVSPRRLGSAALVGLLLLTFGNGMVSIAEQHISTGMAALLVSSVPLWLVIFRAASGDRPPVKTVVGVVIGFTGVALLSLLRDGGSGNVIGVVVILLAALSWSIGSFFSSRLPMPGNTFVASVYEMAAGGLALVVLSLSRGETLDVGQVSTRSWLALAYLITFGSLLAFTSYVWLLDNAPISLVGTYAYVNPAVAVLLGAIVLSEQVSWPIIAGGAVIIAGVGMVVSTERRAKRPAPVAAPEPAPVTK